MSNIIYLPKARLDLESIWLYTLRRWSHEQANKYVSQIYDVCENILGRYKSLKMPCDARVAENLYFIRCGMHIVFFRQTADDCVFIVRILHSKMDFAKHLNG